MRTTLTLKQGEEKPLIITVKNSSGDTVNLTDATLFLGVKSLKTDVEYAFFKDDTEFDKNGVADGVVIVLLEAEDTAVDGKFYGELKILYAGGIIEKSSDFILKIVKAVTNVS